jgi:hypothetical protein
MSAGTGAFSWNEPGIGKFIVYNLIFSISGVGVLVLLENKIGFYLINKIQERILLRNDVLNKDSYVIKFSVLFLIYFVN